MKEKGYTLLELLIVTGIICIIIICVAPGYKRLIRNLKDKAQLQEQLVPFSDINKEILINGNGELGNIPIFKEDMKIEETQEP